MGNQGFTHLDFTLVLLIAALGVLLCAVQPAFHDLQVRQDQFQFKRLGIPHSIGFLQKDIIVIKAADYLDQRIDLADGLEDFVPLSAAGADADHIDKLHRRRRILLRVVVVREPVQPLIGHLRRTHVGLRASVGIGTCLGLGTGQRVKQCCLSDIRQSDYS